MADVVNLRLVRKAQRRDAASATANANRAAFGRSKADKREAANNAGRIAKLLDGAKRER